MMLMILIQWHFLFKGEVSFLFFNNYLFLLDLSFLGNFGLFSWRTVDIKFDLWSF